VELLDEICNETDSTTTTTDDDRSSMAESYDSELPTPCLLCNSNNCIYILDDANTSTHTSDRNNFELDLVDDNHCFDDFDDTSDQITPTTSTKRSSNVTDTSSGWLHATTLSIYILAQSADHPSSSTRKEEEENNEDNNIIQTGIRDIIARMRQKGLMVDDVVCVCCIFQISHTHSAHLFASTPDR
jgi:hypothetical protein